MCAYSTTDGDSIRKSSIFSITLFKYFAASPAWFMGYPHVHCLEAAIKSQSLHHMIDLYTCKAITKCHLGHKYTNPDPPTQVPRSPSASTYTEPTPKSWDHCSNYLLRALRPAGTRCWARYHPDPHLLRRARQQSNNTLRCPRDQVGSKYSCHLLDTAVHRPR